MSERSNNCILDVIECGLLARQIIYGIAELEPEWILGWEFLGLSLDSSIWARFNPGPSSVCSQISVYLCVPTSWTAIRALLQFCSKKGEQPWSCPSATSVVCSLRKNPRCWMNVGSQVFPWSLVSLLTRDKSGCAQLGAGALQGNPASLSPV